MSFGGFRGRAFPSGFVRMSNRGAVRFKRLLPNAVSLGGRVFGFVFGFGSVSCCALGSYSSTRLIARMGRLRAAKCTDTLIL